MSSIFRSIAAGKRRSRYQRLYEKYRDRTMVPPESFAYNLELCEEFGSINGCVVECGVWKGGMSAAIAEVLGVGRRYYLFDSFEGLPAAAEIDGEAARDWQADTASPVYFDNCRADEADAREAMLRSGATEVEIVKGWFNDTLPAAKFSEPIAVLRLDGDWYESTIECLRHLFPKVAAGGLILMDDYYLWDGFSRAVHDYLSENKRTERISQWKNSNVYYMIKRADK